MKLIQTVLSNRGLLRPEWNDRRFELLHGLARISADQDADVLVIPAGFVTVASESELAASAGRVAEIASAHRITIIGGIDITGDRSDLAIHRYVEQGTFPAFGYGIDHAGRVSGPWRQTSQSSGNAEFVPEVRLPAQDRFVLVAEKRVGVVLCGELHSSRVRARFASFGVDATVVLGHGGMGCGLVPAMRVLARNTNSPVALSQHVKHDGNGRRKHYVDSGAVSQPLPESQNRISIDSGLWASWSVRMIELTADDSGRSEARAIAS